jgi:hypothetical protein
LREGEDLKQDRMKFEQEWEVLDENRAAFARELQQIVEEKEMLEKLRRFEDDKLKNEKLATEEYIQRELEAIRLEKPKPSAGVIAGARGGLSQESISRFLLPAT